MSVNPILASLIGQPILVTQSAGAWIEACLETVSEKLAEIEAAQSEAQAQEDDFWFAPDDWRSAYRPYSVKDGVLQIPVKGMLLNNLPYALGDWATGYDYIRRALQRGLTDGNVRGIALIVNSNGGVVAGNFELADRIYAARDVKPIRAFAADRAYSAAYSIASSAEDVTVARGGGVGSIGVMLLHAEASQRHEEMGVRYTIVRSKPGKNEANYFEPLSKDALARLEEHVDYEHKEFVALVARNRGLSEKAVDATNALTFMPHQAIENGLADRIGSLDDALTAFAATFNQEDETMAKETEAQFTEADIAAARAEGAAAGATAERARIQAILSSDAAKTRGKTAMKLATATAMSAEEAIAFMADLPEETKAVVETEKPKGAGAPEGMFAAAMGATPNPELGGGDPASAASEEDSIVARIVGTGPKRR